MNNPCIKTGANIFCRDLNKVLHGDLFFHKSNGFTLKGCPNDLVNAKKEPVAADTMDNCDAMGDFYLNNRIKHSNYHAIPIERIEFTPKFVEYLARWAPYVIEAGNIRESCGCLFWERTNEPINHFLAD